jgi:hypothetical protein
MGKKQDVIDMSELMPVSPTFKKVYYTRRLADYITNYLDELLSLYEIEKGVNPTLYNYENPKVVKNEGFSQLPHEEKSDQDELMKSFHDVQNRIISRTYRNSARIDFRMGTITIETDTFDLSDVVFKVSDVNGNTCSTYIGKKDLINAKIILSKDDYFKAFLTSMDENGNEIIIELKRFHMFSPMAGNEGCKSGLVTFFDKERSLLLINFFHGQRNLKYCKLPILEDFDINNDPLTAYELQFETAVVYDFHSGYEIPNT